ncbi:GMP synthase (glutamine-hydrolyzing) [Nannocystis exedens]|uniref:GMP synthase [glutamine-hydrolyzing] n=1 Tax=Nannocystis exedens TaxID=54 RepID=A0A1I1TIC3_9BACT|nr:glutamine-hydrolyzing GMP synthase [Nannocystis exedens]PCC66620.1 putative GMP synthetase [Nannocystis exedens]SFD56898.1 GMP synthase (glutamine-hydrolyzing) [Nannocystis exedens]
MAHQTLVVLDFGSQVTQLIARRVRELGVYAEILPYHTSAEKLAARAPKAIILSGGPSSLYDEGAPRLDPDVLKLGVPVLGICYGLYLMVAGFGGQVDRATRREYGPATLTVTRPEGPLKRLRAGDRLGVWMSHGDRVVSLPPGFHNLASSDNCEHAVVLDPERKLWGVQFHPEVTHTERGDEIIATFLDAAGFARDWSAARFVDEAVAAVQARVGTSGTVICGLSGGVDSSVAALLVERAIGERLHCIFVDNGVLRKDEREDVERMFAGRLHNKLIVADARERFFSALQGVTDPEVKRKRIGATFIDVFEEEAKKLGGADFLVQGTLYPDVIESVNLRGASVTIKTHHNVGGLPERMRMGVVEPLRELFKDEVRRLGLLLGLPDDMVWRHPFPGPGLAVRVLGEVTPARCDLLREADAIIIEEIRKAGLYRQLWQVFGVLLPVQSVGVMGDGRTYESALAIRAVSSTDAMTADWARLPYELLATMSSRIINEVRGINRVCYDISSKPPATIEWE